MAVKTYLNKHLILNLVGDRADSVWIGEYYTPWIWLQGKGDKRRFERNLNENRISKHTDSENETNVIVSTISISLQFYDITFSFNLNPLFNNININVYQLVCFSFLHCRLLQGPIFKFNFFQTFCGNKAKRGQSVSAPLPGYCLFRNKGEIYCNENRT